MSPSSWYPCPPAKPNGPLGVPVFATSIPKASYVRVAVVLFAASVCLEAVPSRSDRSKVVIPALRCDTPGVYTALPSPSTGAVTPAPSRRYVAVPPLSTLPTLVSRLLYAKLFETPGPEMLVTRDSKSYASVVVPAPDVTEVVRPRSVVPVALDRRPPCEIERSLSPSSI